MKPWTAINIIMRKGMKQTIIGTIITLLIITIVIVSVLIKKFTPSNETMELSDYYNIPNGEAMVIMDNNIYEKNALIIDDMVYLDIDTVKLYYNSRFYWDSNENLLLYTTPTELIKTETGSKIYYVNKTKISVNYVTVKTIGDSVYVAADFICLYSDLEYKLHKEPSRVMLNGITGDYLCMDVSKATQMRVSADIKDEILVTLSVGEKVILVEGGGNQENGFIKVMTEDGVRGYVKKKCLTESYFVKRTNEYMTPEYAHISKDYKINLTWHMVTNMESNESLDSLLGKTKGITTISPTWFRVDSVEGTLSSLASEDYVDKAHSMGIEVWGLFDNFNSNVDTFQLLVRTSRRERLVNEIISAAIKYNLDGINIDFESLTAETGPHFIQFLRELSIKCRGNEIVLSVDNYVPAPYNKFYDLKEQGIILDYVIIMAYDEHHKNSEEAGSVSSVNYVSDAIANTLDMIPAERIITAIPFYTRLWKTTVVTGQSKLTSEALSMAAAADVLTKNGAEAVWDEITEQYYAEYEKDSAKYQIWLEEEESIEVKMKLIHKAGLAGVASWRLGMEKSDIWDILLKYIN